jgi:CBS domain-containing protein
MRSLKVEDVMTRDVVTARAEESLKFVARVMHRANVSAVPVVDGEGRLHGIVSEADLLRVEEEPRRSFPEWMLRTGAFVEAARTAERLTAGQVMTSEVVTVRPDTLLREAIRTLMQAGVKRLPVVDERGVLVGIVSRHDLLMPMIRNDEEIRREVAEAIRWVGIDPAHVSVQVEDGRVTLRGHVDRRTEREMLEALVCRIDGVMELRSFLRGAGADGDDATSSVPPEEVLVPQTEC